MNYGRKHKEALRLRHNSVFILHNSCQRGFTLLFASLIGSLMFSLGIAIAHLSLKEIVFSSAGKQSETAFFAADTGIECALYWDLRVGSTFPKSGSEAGRSSINCNGVSVPITPETSNVTAATSTFTLSFSLAGCAVVRVGKTVSGSTVIE
jgi:hypothetical protein